MTSNSLDFNFTHCNIHGQPCDKNDNIEQIEFQLIPRDIHKYQTPLHKKGRHCVKVHYVLQGSIKFAWHIAYRGNHFEPWNQPMTNRQLPNLTGIKLVYDCNV